MSALTAISSIAVAAAAGGGYITFLVLRFMVRVFLADPTVTFEFVESDAHAESGDLKLEEQRFRTKDGAELRGVLVRGPGDPKGIVVFSPEFGGDSETWRRYAPFVPRAGWWMLAYDFRGTGRSAPWPGHVPRKWASEREVVDLEAAVAHARTLAGGRFSSVYLFGISRGGLASLAVAARDAGVRGVVLEGSGSTLDVIQSYTVKWSRVFAPEWLCGAVPAWTYRLIARLVMRIAELRVGYRFLELTRQAPPASGGQCLFIHGERDRHVTPEMARAAYEAFPGPKDLWMVEHARHNGAVLKQPDAYRERVLAHLDRLHAALETRQSAAG